MDMLVFPVPLDYIFNPEGDVQDVDEGIIGTVVQEPVSTEVRKILKQETKPYTVGRINYYIVEPELWEKIGKKAIEKFEEERDTAVHTIYKRMKHALFTHLSKNNELSTKVVYALDNHESFFPDDMDYTITNIYELMLNTFDSMFEREMDLWPYHIFYRDFFGSPLKKIDTKFIVYFYD